MDEKMQFGKEIPEYYPTMHLDGFKPEEILYATKKKMLQQAYERDQVEEVMIKSEVKLK